MLDALETLTVTAKLFPPLTFLAYQMVRGSFAAPATSTTRVYAFPLLSVIEDTWEVEEFQEETATTTKSPFVTGFVNCVVVEETRPPLLDRLL